MALHIIAIFVIQVLASPEDERRRELMVRFDVIPVDSVTLIALDYFLRSKSAAQIKTTPNKNTTSLPGSVILRTRLAKISTKKGVAG